ncbi:MAG: ATP-binding protein [Candidatus Aminicenantales bacterium]
MDKNNRRKKLFEVLIIEGDTAFARNLQEMLADARNALFDVKSKWADRLSIGLKYLKEGRFDIVLLDLFLPDSAGLRMFTKAYNAAAGVPIVVLTDREKETIAVRAVQKGAQDYLVKEQTDCLLLKNTLLHALERKQAGEELRKYQRHLKELVRQQTAKLKQINEQLRNETIQRQQVEMRLKKRRDYLRELVEERTAELKKLNIKLENKINELKSSEEKYKNLVLTVPDIIYRIDPDGKFIFLNDAVQRLGYKPEELIGKHFSTIIYPADVDNVSRSKVLPKYAGKTTGDKYAPKLFDERRTGERMTTGLEIRLLVKGSKRLKPGFIEPMGKDMVIVEVNSSGMYEINPETKKKVFIGTVGVIRDITERKKTEKAFQDVQRRLMEKEKMAMLGELAGGVGHELRNPLGSIKSAAYFLRMALKDPEPEVRESLKFLEKEVSTSEKIISSLLDFASPKSSTYQKVNVNGIIQKILSDMRLPENIEVECQLDPALPDMLADPGQLSQVFENIILNAVQAMSKGGRFDIKSETFAEPQWITISFTDSGEGIPKERIGRLFEPLFTTRAKGIGLGLAVAKTIVERHGGTINVKSEVGVGSTFTVKLPIKMKEKRRYYGQQS